MLADGAYTPPTDPDAPPSGPQANTGPTYPISDDGSDAPAVAAAICNSYSATLEDTFDYAGAYSCTMGDAQARLMSHDARVVVVEANAHTYPASTETFGSNGLGWGLDRIDQRAALHLGAGAPDGRYTYNTANGGADIDAWIVDTGIWAAAADLQGRVKPEWPNAHGGLTDTCASLHPTGSTVPYTSSDDDDTYGHGTRVASVLGGTRWGVAKGVTFHAVKIASDNGIGNLASLIAGLNYVLNHAVSTTATRYTGRRSVVNISHYYLPSPPGSGNGYYTAADKTNLGSVIGKILAKGIPVVVCAGNNNQDAKYTLPALLSLSYSSTGTVTGSTTGLITAGASTFYTTSSGSTSTYDGMWTDPSNTSGPSTSGSNYGAPITVFAPGQKVFVDFVSYNRNTNTRTEENTQSYDTGTSYSSPYTAGVVALLLENNRAYTPVQAEQWIVNNSTKNVVHPPSGTPDRLLYTNGL